MGPDGEPHEDASASDDGSSSSSSESSVSGGSSPSPSPAPAAPPPPPAPPSNALTPAPPTALLHPHLFYPHPHQQSLLSLHLASPSTNSAPAPSTSAPPVPTPAPERPVRDDCWSENATFTLIQAWGDRYLELNRGNLKQQHWKDVANSVNSRSLTSSKPPKTDVQCKNRIDTLKKKYKIEKSKLTTGGVASKWAFFDRLDELIGSSKKPNSAKVPRASGAGGDGNSFADPDGLAVAIVTATVTATSASKHTIAEEKLKPPLPFILPLPPTQATPLPPFNHFTGAVPHVNHHAALAGSTMNLHLGAGAYITHHVGGGANMNQHVEGINYHHGGGGNNNSHAGSGVPASQHVGNGAAADTTSKSKGGQDMSHSSPHNTMQTDGKRHKRKRDGKRCRESSPFRDLARAILKFGEVYEKVEIAKQQQMAELEKQRMEFTKDLELQRMQLFAQTQIEIAKIRRGRSSNHSNTEHQI